MSYAVKEMFLTLQGEGMQAGRRAVFLRFAGCNLWSGRERDRATAECTFCDTDFVGVDGDGGGRFGDAATLADAVRACWDAGLAAGGGAPPFVVITGGEPMLQLDPALIDALHAMGFEIAVESNGTLPAVAGIDWLCISPKGRTTVVQRRGDELKLVWPQPAVDHRAMDDWHFTHRLIQPMDGPTQQANIADAIGFVMRNPHWRLSTQVHKSLGLR